MGAEQLAIRNVVTTTQENKRAYGAAWRAAHPEKWRSYAAAYCAANPEKVRARKAAYYLKHREDILAYNAHYRSTHHDKEIARRAEYRAMHLEEERARGLSYRSKHIEEERARHRLYNEQHPDKKKAWYDKERIRIAEERKALSGIHPKWIKVESPISNNQQFIPKLPGVYCFYEMFADKTTVIYIGQTNNLYFRISTHTKFNHPYDKSLIVKYKVCLNPSVLEEKLIKRLKPSMNQLIDGRIVKVTIKSEAWQEKLRKQREWRATKKDDPEYKAKNIAQVRKWIEKHKQSEEYILTKKKKDEQRIVARQQHAYWLESDQGQLVKRKKNAANAFSKYHKNPGKHREKKNLFKVFGTKKDITFPLRKSIALVHLGRRLTSHQGVRVALSKECVPKILERINQGETYAAYE